MTNLLQEMLTLEERESLQKGYGPFRRPPRNVHELIVLNDSASRNLLDMIAEKSLDKDDADKIEALYLAHTEVERGKA